MQIRTARPEDATALWELVRGLAQSEQQADRVAGSADQLARDLFGLRPFIEALVADLNGELVGYALFFPTYSSFRTQPMMWLEDLYVTPSQRGQGFGRALMAAVARIATERGCCRLGWGVLPSNTSAARFYESLGAVRDPDDWTAYLLDEGRLKVLAAEELHHGDTETTENH